MCLYLYFFFQALVVGQLEPYKAYTCEDSDNWQGPNKAWQVQPIFTVT